MNWPSARSRRASCPFSTTKREPESFAAVSKSIRRIASPSSKCSFGAAKLRGLPKRLFSMLPCSSAPTGTSGFGRFGISASALSSAALASRSAASSCGAVSLRPATSAISACARASSFFAFAWPISFDSALRRCCASCAAAMARRRSSSSAMSCAAIGASPRFARPSSKACGLSRMKRMSCMDQGCLHASWPALGRPSTTATPKRSEGVDARPEAGHDGAIRGKSLRPSSAGALLRRGACRPLLGALLLDHAHRPDRGLVEGERRDRERELRDHVRRRQHRRDHEHDDDGVAALVDQELRIDDPGLAEQRQDHRHLEADAEGEDQRHDQREILVDLRQELDLGIAHAGAELLHRDREPHQERHRHEVDDERAEEEQERRRDEERQEGLTLVLVEARRDELVDLVRDHREGEEAGAEHRHLELREEELQRMRVDHVRLRRIADGPDIGLHQDVVDVLRAGKAADEHDDESDQRADEPRAQLDQVVDQRRPGGLDFVILRRRHALGLSAGTGPAAAAVSTGSGSGPESAGGGAGKARSKAGSPGSGAAAADAAGSAAGRSGTAAAADAAGSAAGTSGTAAAAFAAGVDSIAPLSSSWIVPSGLNALTCSFSPETSFLMSSSSASRIASLNCDWNSEAIFLTCEVMLPSVRSAFGRSFGPMTMSATAPITSTSPQLMSNMVGPRRLAPSSARRRTAASPRSAGLALADRSGGGRRLRRRRRLVLDGAQRIGRGRRRRRRYGGRLFLAHALLEGFDALRDVAHHVRDLAAPEQQQDDDAHDEPMPNAYATHGSPPAPALPRRGVAWFLAPN